jgi:hypothetical protein
MVRTTTRTDDMIPDNCCDYFSESEWRIDNLRVTVTRTANDRFVCYEDETRGSGRPGYGPPWVLCQCHHLQRPFHPQKPCCSWLLTSIAIMMCFRTSLRPVTNQRGLPVCHHIHLPASTQLDSSPSLAKNGQGQVCQPSRCAP